jgi:pimeloyl-ACP methyl ester carboxylesterase
MERVRIEGTEISYELRGEGEPVAFVHASPFVEWYRPRVDHPPGLITLHYHRQPPQLLGDGFAPLAVNADAATCARLLDHLGWDSVHLVGHSYGAIVALQLPHDAHARVRTMTLLEPAARAVSSSPEAVAALR